MGSLLLLVNFAFVVEGHLHLVTTFRWKDWKLMLAKGALVWKGCSEIRERCGNLMCWADGFGVGKSPQQGTTLA